MAEGGYRVHALDAMTGEEAWVAGVTYPYGTAFTAAVAGGKLYARGDSGEFHTLDASTGELLWSFSAGMGAESPPTVIGGVVYLTSVNTANALDEATGELVWSYGTERFPARDFRPSSRRAHTTSRRTTSSTPWTLRPANPSGPTRPTRPSTPRLSPPTAWYTRALNPAGSTPWTPPPAYWSGAKGRRSGPFSRPRWSTACCTRSPAMGS